MKATPYSELAEGLKAALAQRQKNLVTLSYREDVPPVPAGVLLPIYLREGEHFLAFTRRTELVEHHKGQISFPGGAYQAGDRNLLDTALRESFEEIGLSPSDVQVVGELDDFITGTNFRITPFVGFIPYPYSFNENKFEVAEIIHVSLSGLLDKRHFRQEIYPSGVMGYFYDCKGCTIWGATARILKLFLDIIVDAGLRKGQ